MKSRFLSLLVLLAGCAAPQPSAPPTAPTPAPVALSAALASPELFSFSSASAAVVTVAPASTNWLQAVWAAEPAGSVDGYICFFGNRSGQYSIQITNPAALTIATVSNLDFTQPWYATVTSFVNLGLPVVNCFTNRHGAVTCASNWIYQSASAPEVSYFPPTMLPFITVSGGVAAVSGYGKTGNHYTVVAGTDVASVTNLSGTNIVFETDGTNGPWTCQFPAAGAGFFNTVVRTP